ncbi:MAG: hypothetical protein ACKVQC_04795 [Elusimicrobiota bacterium]
MLNQLKPFSLFITFIYFSTNILWAHTPETTFWKDRKRIANQAQISHSNILLASLPRELPQIQPSRNLSQYLYQNVLPTEKEHFSSILEALPFSYGSVRKIEKPLNKLSTKTIIQIQDVHLNPEAQENISKTIQELIKQKKVDLVALEGAFGSMDFSMFQNYSPQSSVKATADYLLREKKVSGAVYTALTTTSKLPVYEGVDHSSYYKANIAAYQESVPLIEQAKEKLSDMKKDVELEKKTVFSPALLNFDRTIQSYRDNQLSWGPYVEFLSKQSKSHYSHDIEIFLAALHLEKSLHLPQVETERAQLLSRLVEKLSKKEMQGLVNESLAFRLGNIRQGDFYESLKSLCQKHSVNFSSYKAMASYIQYVLMSDQINVEKMLGEVSALEENIYSQLLQTKEEKKLIQKSKQLYLMNKLVNFSLSSQEWDEYQKATIKSEAFLRSFESFYQEALKRDQAMAENLLSAMDKSKANVAVLVAGGFHSEGMSQILKEAGASTILFTPKITKVDDESGSGYLSVFTQEKTPLDKLFEGEKLFITPRVMPEPDAVAKIVAGETTVRGGDAAQSMAQLPVIPPGTEIEVNGQSAILTEPDGTTVTTTVDHEKITHVDALRKIRFMPTLKEWALAVISFIIVALTPSIASGAFGYHESTSFYVSPLLVKLISYFIVFIIPLVFGMIGYWLANRYNRPKNNLWFGEVVQKIFDQISEDGTALYLTINNRLFTYDEVLRDFEGFFGELKRKAPQFNSNSNWRIEIFETAVVRKKIGVINVKLVSVPFRKTNEVFVVLVGALSFFIATWLIVTTPLIKNISLSASQVFLVLGLISLIVLVMALVYQFIKSLSQRNLTKDKLKKYFLDQKKYYQLKELYISLGAKIIRVEFDGKNDASDIQKALEYLDIKNGHYDLDYKEGDIKKNPNLRIYRLKPSDPLELFPVKLTSFLLPAFAVGLIVGMMSGNPIPAQAPKDQPTPGEVQGNKNLKPKEEGPNKETQYKFDSVLGGVHKIEFSENDAKKILLNEQKFILIPDSGKSSDINHITLAYSSIEKRSTLFLFFIRDANGKWFLNGGHFEHVFKEDANNLPKYNFSKGKVFVQDSVDERSIVVQLQSGAIQLFGFQYVSLSGGQFKNQLSPTAIPFQSTFYSVSGTEISDHIEQENVEIEKKPEVKKSRWILLISLSLGIFALVLIVRKIRNSRGSPPEGPQNNFSYSISAHAISQSQSRLVRALRYFTVTPVEEVAHMIAVFVLGSFFGVKINWPKSSLWSSLHIDFNKAPTFIRAAIRLAGPLSLLALSIATYSFLPSFSVLFSHNFTSVQAVAFVLFVLSTTQLLADTVVLPLVSKNLREKSDIYQAGKDLGLVDREVGAIKKILGEVVLKNIGQKLDTNQSERVELTPADWKLTSEELNRVWDEKYSGKTPAQAVRLAEKISSGYSQSQSSDELHTIQVVVKSSDIPLWEAYLRKHLNIRIDFIIDSSPEEKEKFEEMLKQESIYERVQLITRDNLLNEAGLNSQVVETVIHERRNNGLFVFSEELLQSLVSSSGSLPPFLYDIKYINLRDFLNNLPDLPIHNLGFVITAAKLAAQAA